MAGAHRMRRALRRSLPWVAGIGVAAVALSFFGCVVVMGGSMRPALSAGDMVVYRRGSDGVRERDIVLLAQGHSSFVHRVVRIGADGMLVTRGDANPIPDLEPSARGVVLGRGVAVLRTGRFLRGFVACVARARLLYQSHSAKR